MTVTEMKARQERLLEEARVARMVFQVRRTEPTIKISACQPKRVAFALRRLPGVLKADALYDLIRRIVEFRLQKDARREK